MLTDSRVYTTLPVTDPARARAFYAEKLGLHPTEPDGDFYECGGGTRFVISLMGSKPGGHTQMGFLVDDIAATLERITAEGGVTVRARTGVSPELGYYALFKDPNSILWGVWSRN